MDHKTLEAVGQFGCQVVEHRNAPRSPIPLCFTPSALGELIGSVGRWPAETGARGFGPAAGFGIDVVEFDHAGSARARGAVFSPDPGWGHSRLEHWIAQDDLRLFTGDLHSHPGSLGRPSPSVGRGLGDLGMVEMAFELNETMQFFALPILTNTGPDSTIIDIHPWVVSRDDPHVALAAELRICDADEFPERPLNPTWLASLAVVEGEVGHDDHDLVSVTAAVEYHPAEALFDQLFSPGPAWHACHRFLARLGARRSDVHHDREIGGEG